jgi:hypothetical protein
MRKIFLSHSFAERDKVLTAQVESLIRSHGLVAFDGRRLGGGVLTPEIARLIESADAFIALFTLRMNDPGNVTHPWVLLEHGHARLQNKTAIALYESGVPVGGADAGYEHIDYDPAAPIPGFIRLSETIGEWKQRAGRLLKVQVVPDKIAQVLGTRADDVRCECRYHIGGEETAWKPAKVKREVGGVFVYVRVPDDAEMVQLRADGPPPCESPYTPLSMPVQFEPRT